MNRIVALLAASATLASATAATAQTKYFVRVVVQPVATSTPTGGAVVTDGKAGKTYSCGVPAAYGIPSSYPSASEQIGTAASASDASVMCNAVQNANGPATSPTGRVCFWSTKTGATYYSTAGGSSTYGTDPQGFATASCS
jgi:hypothetical protein